MVEYSVGLLILRVMVGGMVVEVRVSKLKGDGSHQSASMSLPSTCRVRCDWLVLKGGPRSCLFKAALAAWSVASLSVAHIRFDPLELDWNIMLLDQVSYLLN